MRTKPCSRLNHSLYHIDKVPKGQPMSAELKLKKLAANIKLYNIQYYNTSLHILQYNPQYLLATPASKPKLSIAKSILNSITIPLPISCKWSKLIGANNSPQSNQRPLQTRRSSYPSVAIETSSSKERYLIKSIRNVLSQSLEPRLLAQMAQGKYKHFNKYRQLIATKQVATRYQIRLSNSSSLARDIGVLGPHKQCRPV